MAPSPALCVLACPWDRRPHTPSCFLLFFWLALQVRVEFDIYTEYLIETLLNPDFLHNIALNPAQVQPMADRGSKSKEYHREYANRAR